VKWRLSNPKDRAFRNFHIWRFSRGVKTTDATMAGELAAAVQVLSQLPYVGVVEKFNESSTRLNAYLRDAFPGFHSEPVVRNAFRTERTMADKLKQMQQELGPDLYRELTEANREDMTFYVQALRLFAESSTK